MIKPLLKLTIIKYLFKLLLMGGGCTLLAIQSTLAQATNQNPGFSITKADQFVTTSRMQPANTTGYSDSVLTLAYTVNNKLVQLELNENTRLTKSLSVQSLPEEVKLYRGKIKDNENSWARITKIDGVLSGAIFDGETLFLVDSSTETFQAMPPEVQSKLDRTQPVIFRARDIEGVLSCGVISYPAQAAPSYQDLVKELSQTLKSTTVKEFTINIHTDTQYERNTSGSVQSNVMSQMNIVDGIFSGQLGIQFDISSIAAVSSSSLDTNDSERLLQRFYDYAYPNSTGLAHLFSGKALDGGYTLGIAYVDSVCHSYGVGVSQAGGRGVAGALTVAHELGHNFGAPHDNQSGPCENTSNQYLMNPYHNDKDQFSDCSIKQINRTVDGVSCYVETEGDDNNYDVLSLPKTLFKTDEPIEISYRKNSSNSRDWIGIYKTGELGPNCSVNDAYVDWRYAGNTSGIISFSGLPVGNYKAQMFSNDGYCYIGEPKSIMVGSIDYAALSLLGLLLLRRRG